LSRAPIQRRPPAVGAAGVLACSMPRMVARLTPSSRAMEETVLSGWVSRSRAWRICSAVMAGGRPRRAACAGGVQALAGALDDQRADELGQRGEDVEDQPPAG
jgi:hypothetical protein